MLLHRFYNFPFLLYLSQSKHSDSAQTLYQ